MATIISLSFILQFLALGVFVGKRTVFFPRLKWATAIFVYLFLMHTAAAYFLKSRLDWVDPRSEAYKKLLQEREKELR